MLGEGPKEILCEKHTLWNPDGKCHRTRPTLSSKKSKKRHIHHPPQRFARCFRLCEMQRWMHTRSSSSIQCFAEFGRKTHNWRLLLFCFRCWKFGPEKDYKRAFVCNRANRGFSFPKGHACRAGPEPNCPCTDNREQAMKPWRKNITFENPCIRSVLGAEDDWSERCGGKGDATAKHWCLLLQKAASCQLGACF